MIARSIRRAFARAFAAASAVVALVAAPAGRRAVVPSRTGRGVLPLGGQAVSLAALGRRMKGEPVTVITG